MKKSILILTSIIFLALGLRMYKLGSVPVSPDWDEAALGYNAYSIVKTGRDEYGTFLPLSIRSFGDYKPPLYTYLAVPSVGLFGLSTWSTRLPSAIFGVLAVLGVYLMVHEICLLERDRNRAFTSLRRVLFEGDTLALLAAFLLAISPWHLQFSRIAFESNIGVTFNIWAVFTFLRGLRQRAWLPVSVIFVGFGLYAYHSERIFLPLLVVLLLVIFRSQIFKKENAKTILFSGILASIFIIPFLFVMFNAAGLERLKGTSAFGNQIQLLSRNIIKFEADKMSGDQFGAFLDNRRFVWAKTMVSGYLSHFSVKWLFLNGDNPRHHAPSMGLLYLWELPFLFYGMYVVLTLFSAPSALLLFGWLLLSPVAASVTTGLPHAVRTLVFLPMFQIFTAVGIVSGVYAFRSTIFPAHRKIGIASVIFFIGCMVFNFAYYMDMYYVQQNPETSEDWQYGYEQIVDIAQKEKQNYKKVIVSTSLDQSYIFFLFYTKFDPARYIQSGGTGAMRPNDARFAFDTYEFRPISWDNEIQDGSVMYIGAPKDIPASRGEVYSFLNGKPSFIIAK